MAKASDYGSEDSRENSILTMLSSPTHECDISPFLYVILNLHQQHFLSFSVESISLVRFIHKYLIGFFHAIRNNSFYFTFQIVNCLYKELQMIFVY